MSAARLALWTDYERAGGRYVGALARLDERSVTVRRVDGDDKLTVGVARSEWSALGGRRRMVLRLTWPEGTVEEWRITRVQQDARDSAWLVLDALPPLAELMTGGPVLRVVNGEVLTTLTGDLPVSEWIDTYVLPHQAAQRLGLTRGALGADPTVSLAFDAPTPGQVVLACRDEAQLEVVLVREPNGAYTLTMPRAMGSAAPVLVARPEGPGANVLAMGVTEDDAELATVVLPLGAQDADGDRATVATVRFRANAIAGDWVELTTGVAADRIILVDSQWVGAWVWTRAGFRAEIVESRASDGRVRLSTVAGLTVGDRVGLAMDAQETPLVEVWSAAGLAADGRRVVPLTLSARGEANELTNGDFADGLAGWTPVNQGSTPSHALIGRGELGLTLTGEANGARGALTSTATPFSVRGLPPDAWVRQGDKLEVAGVTYTITTDEVPNLSGQLQTVGITPTLAAALTDNTAFILERRDRRVLTTRGAWHPLNVWWPCLGTNADYMAGTMNPGTHTIPAMGWALPATTFMAAQHYEVSEANAVLVRAGAVAISPDGVTPALAATHPTWTGHDVHTSFLHNTGGVLGFPNRWTVRINTWPSLVVGTTRVAFWGASSAATLYDTAARSGAAQSAYVCGRVIGTVDHADGTSTLTVEADVPTGFTAVRVNPSNYGQVVGNDALKLAFLSNAALVADAASLEVGWRFGPPLTINLSGSAAAGASSLSFKASTPLATLGVSAGTQLTVVRNVGGVFVTDTLTASNTASFSSAGVMTVPISPATAHAYVKGQQIAVNGATCYLTADYAAGATSLVVQGYHGANVAITLGGSTGTPRSTLYVPGNTLYAGASVQANGSGVAAITLKAANPNAITDGQPVSIVRPDLLDTADGTTGFVLRLLGTPYTPPATAALPALAQSFRVEVPTGQARTVTAFVTVALGAGLYALGSQPTLLLLNGAGGILARVVLDEAATIEAMTTPTEARLIASTTLLASDTLTVRVLGGAGDGRWMVVKDAMLALTASEDVPFTRDSHANTLAMAAAGVLALRSDAVAAVTVDLVTLRRWTDAPGDVLVPQPGQLVRALGAGVAGADITRRVLAVERRVLAPDVGRVELGTVATDLSRRVAKLLAASGGR